MKAISIRQPWAWAIICAKKDIENRKWATSYRGPVLIHAGKALHVIKPADLAEAVKPKGISLGQVPLTLPRGGIVGIADLCDCVEHSNSPWFDGPYGFVLKNVRPLPFMACAGALGLFNVALTREQRRKIATLS